MILQGKKILFLMTGSISCYKACSLISKLVQAGALVEVVLSKSAQEFIGNATIEGLIGKPPISEAVFEPGQMMDHIHLIREVDLILVCPATANFINKMVSGIGDDLLSTLWLAHDFKKPFVMVPSMNTKMLEHPVTQESIRKLTQLGVFILESGSGSLACGEVGYGRLLEPDQVLIEIKNILTTQSPSKLLIEEKENQSFKQSKTLRVCITGGNTKEPLDDVRFLTNHSTGETASRLADAFQQIGLEVVYVHGKGSKLPHSFCVLREFSSFKDLQTVLKKTLNEIEFDWVIHTAAVGDFSIEKILDLKGHDVSGAKLSSEFPLTLSLVPNPKIVDSIKSWSKNQKVIVVAFKLTSNAQETEALQAVQKLFKHSSVDFVVCNDLQSISKDGHAFKVYDGSLNQVTQGQTKKALGQELLSLIMLQDFT